MTEGVFKRFSPPVLRAVNMLTRTRAFHNTTSLQLFADTNCAHDNDGGVVLRKPANLPETNGKACLQVTRCRRSYFVPRSQQHDRLPHAKFRRTKQRAGTPRI